MALDFRQSYREEHQKRNKAESPSKHLLSYQCKSGMIHVHNVYVDVLAESHLVHFQV